MPLPKKEPRFPRGPWATIRFTLVVVALIILLVTVVPAFFGHKVDTDHTPDRPPAPSVTK